jgi:hypothetical protein
MGDETSVGQAGIQEMKQEDEKIRWEARLSAKNKEEGRSGTSAMIQRKGGKARRRTRPTDKLTHRCGGLGECSGGELNTVERCRRERPGTEVVLPG